MASRTRVDGGRPQDGWRGRLLLLVVVATLAVPPRAVVAAPPVRDGDRRIAKTVTSWQSLKRRHVVMQSRDYSCGAAALATIVRYYLGDNVDESYFLKQLDGLLTPTEAADRIENGLAMSDLRRAAVSAGYQAATVKMTLGKLFEAKAPVIVGLDVDGYKHFVVYRGFDGAWVYLADPIRGNLRIKPADFQAQWQKNLALAVAKPGQKPNFSSRLALSADDVLLGESNRRLIQMQAGRGGLHESTPTRN